MELPQLGEHLDARYELLEVLGEGGFAVVYRAVDHRVSRDVAVKVLKPGLDGYDSNREERFLRELRAIANLKSRHTVKLFDYGRTKKGIHYMVCEFAEGEDLSTMLSRVGQLSERETGDIIHQVLRSLREAHDLGLLHRDIKPANIRIHLNQKGRLVAKVLDFGLAKSLGANEIPLTAAGKVVGTPRYMSPEQLMGEELTGATDIYSLGLVAYECLMGPMSVPTGLAKRRVLRLSTQDVNPALAGVVNRMLARSVDARLETVQDVLEMMPSLRSLSGMRPSTGTAVVVEEPEPETVDALPPRLVETIEDFATTDEMEPGGTEVSPEEQATRAEPRAPAPLPVELKSSEVRALRRAERGRRPKELRNASKQLKRKSPWRFTLPVVAAILGVAGVVSLAVELWPDAPARTQPQYPARLLVAPTSPEPMPEPEVSVGCEVAWTAQRATIPSRLIERWSYVTIIPESDVEQRVPLVIFLTSAEVASSGGTGLRAAAAERGFALIEVPATEGRGRIEDAVDTAKQTLCVDPERIFGISVGGAASDRVSDLGSLPVSGLVTMGARVQPPLLAVPHLHFWNLEDRRLPRRTATGWSECASPKSFERFASDWRDRNMCVEKFETWRGRIECEMAQCAAPWVVCSIRAGAIWEIETSCSGGPPAREYPYAELTFDFFDDLQDPTTHLNAK